MSNQPQRQNTDLHDRLLDTALREVVGRETPPDLSKKILAAAEKSQPLATLGDDTMTKQQKTRRKRNFYIGAVLAASLLVGAMVTLPAFQARREAARRPTRVISRIESKTKKPTILKDRIVDNTVGEAVKKALSKPEVEVWRQIIEKDENKKLMMAVTPHIIIEEGEEERLGIAAQPGELPAYSDDLGKPVRDSSFGLTVPRFVPLFSKGLPSSGNGTIVFYNKQKGAGYGGESPTTPSEPLGWRGRKPADNGGLPSSSGPALIARRREIARQLRQKIEKYQTLAEELGGAESPITNAVLNMKINEVRLIKSQIIEAKQELIDANVTRAVAEQQTRSPAALEQAVAMTLGQDPMLANYKAQEFTLLQQIRSSKAAVKQSSSTDIKRLERALQAMQQESQKYRQETEAATRTALKSAPNEYLSTMMTEFVLRRDVITNQIVKLEKQYEAKVAEIEKKGDRSGQLALLEAEIEQLQLLEQGQAPDASGDRYTRIYENPFIAAEGEQAVSTFSIDVDTASYANVRQFLMQSGQLPPPDAVRIEELVNYFPYDYTAPTDDTPFAAHVEVAGCPWHAEHRLVRVGIKGHEIANEKRPQSNLVFLIDVSGSMNEPAKLPLLVSGLKMLTRELGENDRVAIVVYASSEGLALPSTRGDQQAVILAALEKLRAGGSTAGGAGIQLAYKIARENFIEGGVNRVILATDGDFNVGTTSTAELERLAESNAQETGVFLTVLGFGRGNLNDAMMEAISGKGNGNYHYVDNRAEARKVLVEEISGTLVTIAKDVKIQIEFNPAQVAAYRLIGYENRMLETQDFNDDKKDAGEIGAGHTVTAIYEVVPAGVALETPAVDPLKYQPRAEAAEKAPQPKNGAASVADNNDELLTLKLRYKQPDGDKSTKLEFPITDNGLSFAEATDDFKFASAVASFGMLLRHSEHSGNASYAAVSEIAEESLGKDLHGYRAEFLQLVRQAKQLAGE